VRGTWLEVSLTGNPERYIILETELFSPYRGSVGVTWRKGSYTKGFKNHVIEVSGRECYFYRLRKVLRHLAREGLANMFICPEPVLIYFSVMYTLVIGGLISFLFLTRTF
jgi:hypothetical protein